MALTVFAVESAVVSVLNSLRGGMPLSAMYVYLDATTVALNWLLPLLIVYKVEGRGSDSLGLDVPKERHRIYLLYGVLGLALPAIRFGLNPGLLIGLLEQLLLIGLAEEFFFRGYIMTRLCEWLGESRGLLLNALVFSLAHVIFILTTSGLDHPIFLIQTSLQTLLGGLMLGYVFLRSGNIVPGSIIHVSMNLFLS